MSLRFLAFFGANRYFQFYYPRVESILKKEEKQIQGFNGSVIITVENDALRYHRYDDYGMNHSIGWGHSYNGEWIDSNGLVYLRARYYDPMVGRFIMIDQDYKGDKKNIVSQNRYTYAMNNPYRYVDRDGNAAIEPEGGGSGSGSSSAGTRSLASLATHTRTTSGQHQSQTVRATTPRASVAETILTPREEPPRGNEIINTDRNTPKPDIPVIDCPNDVVGDFLNGVIGGIGDFIYGFVDGIAYGAKQAIQLAWDKAVSLCSDALELIVCFSKLVDVVLRGIATGLSSIYEFIGTLLDKAINMFTNLGATIVVVVGGLSILISLGGLASAALGYFGVAAFLAGMASAVGGIAFILGPLVMMGTCYQFLTGLAGYTPMGIKLDEAEKQERVQKAIGNAFTTYLGMA